MQLYYIFDQFMQNQHSYWEPSETCLRLLLIQIGLRRSVCGNIIILDLFHCASLWQTIHWSGLSICLRAVLSLQSLCLLLCLSACCLAELLWDALSCCKDLLVSVKTKQNHFVVLFLGYKETLLCFATWRLLNLWCPFLPLLTFTNAEWLSLPKILQIMETIFSFCDIILKFGIQLV